MPHAIYSFGKTLALAVIGGGLTITAGALVLGLGSSPADAQVETLVALAELYDQRLSTPINLRMTASAANAAEIAMSVASTAVGM